MSFEITVAEIEQFRANAIQIAQQKVSKTWPYVQVKDNVKGKSEYFERIGKSKMRKRTTRFAESPQMDTPHSRRKVSLEVFDWGDFVDNSDVRRVLIDPASAYTISAGFAVGRQKDAVIIDACTGNAYGGAAGSDVIALPAAQKIVANNIGMTVAKVAEAKEKMDKAEIDEEGRVMLYSSDQFSDLLEDARFTSKDYIDIERLVTGRVDTYMGFKWLRIEPRKAAPTAGAASGDNEHGLPYNATTDVTTCVAFWGLGLGLAIGQIEKFEFAKRADRSFANYLFCEMDIGATRIQEEAVVTIDCDNSPV